MNMVNGIYIFLSMRLSWRVFLILKIIKIFKIDFWENCTTVFLGYEVWNYNVMKERGRVW